MGKKKWVVHDAGDWGPEEADALVEYLQAHDVLPQSHTLLGDAEIARLAFTLSSPLADRDAKKGAMILLAHCSSPRATAELSRCAAALDPSLRRFAALALDESKEWSQAVPMLLS